MYKKLEDDKCGKKREKKTEEIYGIFTYVIYI